MPILEDIQMTPSSQESWFAESSIRISATFSDASPWGTGSGIDRIWHGLYPSGIVPNESEIKNPNSHLSICQTDSCMVHEFNDIIDVSDGSWMWWYLVKDQSGNELIGHSPTHTMIDTTSPTFMSGPDLIIGQQGDFVATWEADDGEGSGLIGYLYQIDSCEFTEQIPTLATTISFTPSTSQTALTGPPAIIPVPFVAALNIILPEPSLAFTS